MERTPKHGTNHKTWPAWLGVTGVVLVAGAVIALVVINPGKPKPHPPLCQYAAAHVTVVVDNYAFCNAVMQQVADNDDQDPWILVKHPSGEQFARLTNGKAIISIYENGNRPLAGKLADHFQAARWRPVVPSGLTASPS